MVTNKCRLCRGTIDADGYCESGECPESCAVTATCPQAATDWPDTFRNFDRSMLDESDMTAAQCDGCGAWATVYFRAEAWTADGDCESACYCAKCDARALSPDYGHQPQGWKPGGRAGW